MTPTKPKFPEVFRTAEEEEAAAGSLCRYIENIVFVGEEDETITEVATENGRYVILEALDEPQVRYKFLFEGKSEDGHWKVVVRSEGEYPDETYNFDQLEGGVKLLRSLLKPYY